MGTRRHEVAAAVLRRGETVLLCHRRPDLPWFPDSWDLVGGHIEDGETAADALVRECREELDIDIATPTVPVVVVEDDDMHLTVYAVDRWTGEPANVAPEEHDEIRWFTLDDLPGLRLADPRLHDLLRTTVGVKRS